jgi:hypothetical protein
MDTAVLEPEQNTNEKPVQHLDVLGTWNGYRVLVATVEKKMFVPKRVNGKIVFRENGKPVTVLVWLRRIYFTFGGFTYSAGRVRRRIQVKDPRPKQGPLDWPSKPLPWFLAECRRMLGADGASAIERAILDFLE